MQQDGITADFVACIETPTFDALNALSIQHSDGLIIGSNTSLPKPPNPLKMRGSRSRIPREEGYVTDINNFYDTILEGKAEAVS